MYTPIYLASQEAEHFNHLQCVPLCLSAVIPHSPSEAISVDFYHCIWDLAIAEFYKNESIHYVFFITCFFYKAFVIIYFAVSISSSFLFIAGLMGSIVWL